MDLHDADEYCRQKTAPAGSGFYYSILFYPEQQRRDLRALHALGIELEEIITECSDPGVVQMKCAWWHDEIMRLYQNAARHPVTRALADVISRQDIPQVQLQEIINFVAQAAMTPPPEIVSLSGTGPGLVWQLSASICGYEIPESMALAGEMGGQFSWFNNLQRVGTGLNPATRLTDPERRLQIHNIHKTLSHHCAVFPRADRHRLLHVLIMAHIIIRTCESILRNDTSPVLTPLRKLWIAWRLHRRYH
jgi:phytoene synthase